MTHKHLTYTRYASFPRGDTIWKSVTLTHVQGHNKRFSLKNKTFFPKKWKLFEVQQLSCKLLCMLSRGVKCTLDGSQKIIWILRCSSWHIELYGIPPPSLKRCMAIQIYTIGLLWHTSYFHGKTFAFWHHNLSCDYQIS